MSLQVLMPALQLTSVEVFYILSENCDDRVLNILAGVFELKMRQCLLSFQIKVTQSLSFLVLTTSGDFQQDSFADRVTLLHH